MRNALKRTMARGRDAGIARRVHSARARSARGNDIKMNDASSLPTHLPTVVVIGDSIVDISVMGMTHLPAWGADRDCSSVAMLPGGSAANVARQLGSIGSDVLSVSFLSTVGDDEMGRFFRRTLVAEGRLADADATLHVLTDTPQSTCIVLSGPSDRAMVTCYASVHKLQIDLFAEFGALESAAIVHISGYFNCRGLHTPQCLEVIKACRQRGSLICVDPQYDCTETWTGVDGHLAKLLPLVDVFLPNEVEAMGISGKRTPTEALEALSSQHPHCLIIISIGADGALAARGSERWEQPALVAPFVDATGAGDAFDAGCLLSLLRNPRDVESALRHGIAAGAVAIGEVGACEHPIRRGYFEAVLKDGSARLAIAE